MSEIKVNIENLEEAIAELNKYASDWACNSTTPPTTVGGGKTVNELEELAKIYKELNDHMVLLASSTATFFTDVKNSYQESDHKAASNISGK